MNLTFRIIPTIRLIRTYATSFNKMSKLGRCMNKLVRGSNTMKKKWYDNEGSFKETLPTLKNLTDTKGQHFKSANRRISMLNKLFMQHITDQMSSGEIATKLYGLQIEISKVRVCSDFKIVLVSWLARGTPDDLKVQDTLKEISGLLRHELSQLRLMGEVPRITFVKDKEQAKITEVDLQLSQADFGDDHIRIDPSQLIRSEFVLNIKLDPQIKESIKKMEEKEALISEDPLPPISVAIFGLDREVIMKRVLLGMEKSKKAWANDESDYDDNVAYTNKGMKGEHFHVDKVNRKEEFQEFLRQRKIAKRKALRAVEEEMNTARYEEEIGDDIDIHFDAKSIEDTIYIEYDEDVKDEIFK